MLNRGSGTFIV
uniref:Uncharacterized protein n=1 Tax=Arundo donax TaxID=35708 RepID=A0A0A9AF01_ARUDO